MDSIKEAIQKAMCVLENRIKCSPEGAAEAGLKKALTKKELSHIKFQYLHKGVLGISVDSSSWLYHLSLKKETLLAKVNKEGSTIKDIRFRIGEVG